MTYRTGVTKRRNRENTWDLGEISRAGNIKVDSTFPTTRGESK